MVAVLSIVAVVSVYAVLIGTFTGGKVTVGSAGSGPLTYSDNNADPWILALAPTDASWYARVELNAGGFSGPVTIAWHLEKETGTDVWAPVTGATATTNIVLNGTGGNVYATSDGSFASNLDWGTKVTGSGTYRVIATVDST